MKSIQIEESKKIVTHAGDVDLAQQSVLKLSVALDEVVGAHYSWP